MVRVLGILCLVSLFAAPGLAGIGNPEINYEMAYTGTEPVCLMVVPNGTGPDFTQARTISGHSVDVTITVEILDLNYDPIAMYPAEDIWLETLDDGLVACPSGVIADGPTDATGQTTFTIPPYAGGWDTALAQVVVSGWISTSSPGINLSFNSPDLNGDLEVNLSDVQLFAADFYGSYQHRSDLAFDGTVNLSDIVPLANSMGAVCP